MFLPQSCHQVDDTLRFHGINGNPSTVLKRLMGNRFQPKLVATTERFALDAVAFKRSFVPPVAIEAVAFRTAPVETVIVNQPHMFSLTPSSTSQWSASSSAQDGA